MRKWNLMSCIERLRRFLLQVISFRQIPGAMQRFRIDRIGDQYHQLGASDRIHLCIETLTLAGSVLRALQLTEGHQITTLVQSVELFAPPTSRLLLAQIQIQIQSKTLILLHLPQAACALDVEREAKTNGIERSMPIGSTKHQSEQLRKQSLGKIARVEAKVVAEVAPLPKGIHITVELVQDHELSTGVEEDQVAVNQGQEV